MSEPPLQVPSAQFLENFLVPLFGVRSPLISASLLFRCMNSRCTRCTGRVHNASAACGTWIANRGLCCVISALGDNFHILRGSNVGNQLESEILHPSSPSGAPARRSISRAMQKMQIYAATQLFFPRESGGKEGGGPVAARCVTLHAPLSRRSTRPSSCSASP